MEVVMTELGEKMLAGAREALAAVRGDASVIAGLKVTPSCGCVFCDLGLEPVKLRRRWVHHLPRQGKLIACDFKNLKPRS
jgi:hypothetical protein